jgi:thiol-disulfide isomerase/thioredoxin
MSKIDLLLPAFFLIMDLLPQQAVSQMNPNDIINKLIDKRASYESLSYDIKFRNKAFSKDDTINYNAKVELIRVPEDTLFHGHVFMDMDTAWYGYDGEKIFSRNIETNEVIYDNAATSPGLFILSNIRNNLVDDGFLKMNTGLRQVISDPQYNCHFTDDFIDGVHCLGLSFRAPDDAEFTNHVYFVAIDTAEYYIKKKTYSVYYQGNEQYQEWNYSNLKFGHETSIPELDFKTFGNNAKETQFIGGNIGDSSVPDFEWSSLSGNLFNTGERIDIKNVKARYIILDFWYSSCYPCIKSIPAVRDMASKYDRKDVAVFGVNMIDDPVKSKSRLDKFFSNNPMPYPALMLDLNYGTKINLAYPTFLILNSKYEVVFQETGFKENLYEEATAFLDARLK